MPHHFVCSECGYMSHILGTCQNEDCIKLGVKLTECHCEDEKHAMILRSHDTTEGDDVNEQEEEARKNGYSINTIDLDTESDL